MNSYRVRDVVPFEGRFASWEAFDQARKAHCERTYTMYVCRNTVKVEVANKRRAMQVPSSWVYDRKVYVCTHGYKRVSRSKGSRPRQKVRYTSCRAGFTAAVVREVIDNKEVLCIKITAQHLEHDDHPVNYEQWRNYSQNRASIADHPYLAHEAELLRRIGSNKRVAREHIESLSGKVCTMKDMHNLYARLRKKEESIKSLTTPASATNVSSNPTSNTTVSGIINSQSFGPIPSLAHHRLSSSFASPSTGNVRPGSNNNHTICSLTALATPNSILNSSKDAEPVLHFPLNAARSTLTNTVTHEHNSNRASVRCVTGYVTAPGGGAGACSSAGCDILVPSTTPGATSTSMSCGIAGILDTTTAASEVGRVEHTLQQFVDAHVENHASILAGDDGCNEAICVATKNMKELFQVFPQMVILDSTMSRRLQNYQMHGFLCMDAIGNARPVFLAQSMHASVPLFRRICDDFKRTHPKWPEVKVFIVEKTMPEIFVLESQFPEARVLLCQFTSVKLLCSLATNPEYGLDTAELQEEVLSTLKRLVFACSEVEYLEAKNYLYQLLENRADHPLWVHFEQAWEPYCRVWVKYLRHECDLLADYPSLTRLETYWKPLRGSFEMGRTPTKAMEEVLTLVRFIEDEWTSKLLILELTKPMTDFSDRVLYFLVNCLSSFCVRLIASQVAIVNAFGNGFSQVSSKTDNRVTIWETRRSPKRVVAVVNKRTRACDCLFYSVYGLPCQHLIWYELQALGQDQLSMNTIHERWFLRTFHLPALVSLKESNEIEYHIL